MQKLWLYRGCVKAIEGAPNTGLHLKSYNSHCWNGNEIKVSKQKFLDNV